YQGTPGKLALGLFVTDMEGKRVTFARASGRFFAKIITGLIPLFIGYIMAGFTAKKQALHDMIASCLVLRRG
ncbi:MAG TPA: RDD family protein, partial [Candidatus Acidoferrales bacterium]|nr:RDD family protein [Candidatus Acidoferrales bacterium]